MAKLFFLLQNRNGVETGIEEKINSGRKKQAFYYKGDVEVGSELILMLKYDTWENAYLIKAVKITAIYNFEIFFYNDGTLGMKLNGEKISSELMHMIIENDGSYWSEFYYKFWYKTQQGRNISVGKLVIWDKNINYDC